MNKMRKHVSAKITPALWLLPLLLGMACSVPTVTMPIELACVWQVLPAEDTLQVMEKDKAEKQVFLPISEKYVSQVCLEGIWQSRYGLVRGPPLV